MLQHQLLVLKFLLMVVAVNNLWVTHLLACRILGRSCVRGHSMSSSVLPEFTIADAQHTLRVDVAIAHVHVILVGVLNSSCSRYLLTQHAVPTIQYP